MLETELELRRQFYTETNIKAEPNEYAQWLENLAIEKLNNELVWQNQLFRETYEKVIEVLQLSLISRVG